MLLILMCMSARKDFAIKPIIGWSYGNQGINRVEWVFFKFLNGHSYTMWTTLRRPY